MQKVWPVPQPLPTWWARSVRGARPVAAVSGSRGFTAARRPSWGEADGRAACVPGDRDRVDALAIHRAGFVAYARRRSDGSGAARGHGDSSARAQYRCGCALFPALLDNDPAHGMFDAGAGTMLTSIALPERIEFCQVVGDALLAGGVEFGRRCGRVVCTFPRSAGASATCRARPPARGPARPAGRLLFLFGA